MGTLHHLPARPVDRHSCAETVATSDYLNMPLRTEAEVVSLRERRMAVMPASLPADTEPAA